MALYCSVCGKHVNEYGAQPVFTCPCVLIGPGAHAVRLDRIEWVDVLCGPWSD